MNVMADTLKEIDLTIDTTDTAIGITEIENGNYTESYIVEELTDKRSVDGFQRFLQLLHKC